MKMRAFRPVLAVAPLVAALTVAQLSSAQTPVNPPTKPDQVPADQREGVPLDLNNPGFGGVSFQTNVGSFKVLGSDPTLVEGKLEFSFKGTVLVSNLQHGSTVTLGNGVRKEYETDDHGKTVYFGDGKITILGRFRAVQFFGQNLKGHFTGWGFFRFYGEFDKNLETGSYQVDGGPKMPLNTGGSVFSIPNTYSGGTGGKIKVKKAGG